MSRVKDTQTLDLFEIPQATVCVPGETQYHREVSELVSLLLKDSGAADRWSIAAEVSRKAEKDVSKNMLDAYASPARIDHALPFWVAPILEEVCQSHLLTDWLVAKRGGRVAYGRDALKQELGRLMLLKEQALKNINQQIKRLEAVLEK